MEGEMRYLGDRKSKKGNKLGRLEKQTNFTNLLVVPANCLEFSLPGEAGEERGGFPSGVGKGWVEE